MPAIFSVSPKAAQPPSYRSTRSWLPRRSRWLLFLPIVLILYWCLPISPIHFGDTVHAPSIRYKSVDWSRYAYSQYATNSAYLCNSVMIFEALSRLGSRADRVLFYPEEWDTEIAGTKDRDSQLLVKARDWYNVKLIPMEMRLVNDESWNSSFTKFLAWGQSAYERIIHLDSDVTVLQHLDDLFLLPKAPVAMTRAYWGLSDIKELTSLFILLKPSEVEFKRLMAATIENKGRQIYDMDIMNQLYGQSAMVLPHRTYGLLSGEFRAENHKNYLGNDYDLWDPEEVLKEASLVHFSDWPLPKPWIMWPHNLIGEMTPKCKKGMDGEEWDCRDRRAWLGLYNDFRKRRKVCLDNSLITCYAKQVMQEICALLSAPAPEWPPRNTSSS